MSEETHNQKEKDVLKLLAALCHIGVDNVSADMQSYAHGRNEQGI